MKFKIPRDEELVVSFPKGILGLSSWTTDTKLEYMIRQLAKDTVKDWADEAAVKEATIYGTNFENEIFSMHVCCTCDKETCPWCAGCSCPDDSYHYLLDGEEVSDSEFREIINRAVQGLQPGTPAFIAAFKAADRRRKLLREEEKICQFCRDGGHAAPNFYYKPTELKVWWWKNIGRTTETNIEPRELTRDEVDAILAHCLRSLPDTQV